MIMSFFCNGCGDYVLEINKLEDEELEKKGFFVCSDCLNKELNKGGIKRTEYRCTDCKTEWQTKMKRARCKNCQSLNIERKLPSSKWITASEWSEEDA